MHSLYNCLLCFVHTVLICLWALFSIVSLSWSNCVSSVVTATNLWHQYIMSVSVSSWTLGALEVLYYDVPHFFWDQQEYAENYRSLKIIKYPLYKYNMTKLHIIYVIPVIVRYGHYTCKSWLYIYMYKLHFIYRKWKLQYKL